MKLAFICTEKLPSPAVKGGAIQMMIDGVAPFLSKNHSLTIFSITDPELPDREDDQIIHYIRFPREEYRFLVAEELKQHEFDVIHVFNRPKNVKLYKEAAPNSKIVLSLHNDMFSERKISDIEGAEAINLTTVITTVSNYIKQTITSRFPEAEGKIQVVYSGVDLQCFTPVWTKKGQLIREKYRSRFHLNGKKVVLFIGRLSKTKGPDLLIEALKLLRKKYKEAVLVIVGGKWFSDNRMNAYVKSLYELAEPLKEQIVFTKYIPANEIPNILLIGDVFVCSSQWNEPLARVNYEAMAAGIPLITTKRGGNHEVILPEYNGLLVEEHDDPVSFAKAVHYIFSEPELAERMALNGRTFIELNFTFKHVSERLEAAYMMALNNNLEPDGKMAGLEAEVDNASQVMDASCANQEKETFTDELEGDIMSGNLEDGGLDGNQEN